MAAQFGNFNGTVAAVGTTPITGTNMREQGEFQFIIANLTGGETIAISGTTDGINFEATAFKPIDDATGNPTATTALPNGTYRLPFRQYSNYIAYKFVKSAAVNNVNVAYICHRDVLGYPFENFSPVLAANYT